MITSISDLLNAQGHFPRQRFVEYFSGKGGTNVPSAIWAFQDVIGSGGSGAMSDVIDDGYVITTSSSTLDASNIDFNNIRPFSNTSSVCLSTCKRGNTDVRFAVGLCNTGVVSTGNTDKAVWYHDAGANEALWTADGTTNSDTATSHSPNTSWHDYRTDLSSTNCKAYRDNVLEITKTSNLPLLRLQPVFEARAGTGGVDPAHIRYLEVYNK